MSRFYHRALCALVLLVFCVPLMALADVSITTDYQSAESTGGRGGS